MGPLTDTQLLIIVLSVFIFLLLIVLVLIRKKSQSPRLPDTKHILEAIGKDNIQAIDYVRHKIVVKTYDIKQCNLNALKDTGAVGINIVGPTIKFYYPTDNEKVYKNLKLERNG